MNSMHFFTLIIEDRLLGKEDGERAQVYNPPRVNSLLMSVVF